MVRSDLQHAQANLSLTLTLSRANLINQHWINIDEQKRNTFKYAQIKLSKIMLGYVKKLQTTNEKRRKNGGLAANFLVAKIDWDPFTIIQNSANL